MLSGYLNAKLLWNPAYDEDAAIDEFLEGVYGDAAPYIRRYIDLLHDRVERENIHMDIWIGPNHPVLNDRVLARAGRLWDKAERAVADEPQVRERVKIGRLSVDFAMIERARRAGLEMFTIDRATGIPCLDPSLAARIERFIDVATRNGVTNLREQNGALDLYREELTTLLASADAPMQAAVQAQGVEPGLRVRMYEGTWHALPDFSGLTVGSEGVAGRFRSDVLGGPEAFALRFEGFIEAPVTGLYWFEMTSNDGSKLVIGDREVINHDGLHGSTTRIGIIPLAAGFHPIHVDYFNAGGKQQLRLAWQGPGTPRREIESGALWHRP